MSAARRSSPVISAATCRNTARRYGARGPEAFVVHRVLPPRLDVVFSDVVVRREGDDDEIHPSGPRLVLLRQIVRVVPHSRVVHEDHLPGFHGVRVHGFRPRVRSRTPATSEVNPRCPSVRHVLPTDATQANVLESVLVHPLGNHLPAHVRRRNVRGDADEMHADVDVGARGVPGIEARVRGESRDDLSKLRKRCRLPRNASKSAIRFGAVVVPVGPRGGGVIGARGERVPRRLVELRVGKLDEGGEVDVVDERRRVEFVARVAFARRGDPPSTTERSRASRRVRGRKKWRYLLYARNRPMPMFWTYGSRGSAS